MIQLKHLFKWYNVGGTRSFVLKDVSLDIAEGDFISIMGPSGSGKSTLLNIIGMLDEPDEGEYIFMDENVLEMKAKKTVATLPISYWICISGLPFTG